MTVSKLKARLARARAVKHEKKKLRGSLGLSKQTIVSRNDFMAVVETMVEMNDNFADEAQGIIWLPSAIA